MKEKIEDIDCEPKWISLYTLFCDILDNGNAMQKDFVKEELKRLCLIADNYRFEQKEKLKIDGKTHQG